jgi:predicted SPOUT superfamily RNA methylase MTH1
MCGSTDLLALRSKMWKQTTCSNGKCMVRKTVSCDKICKLKNWGYKVTACSKALCDVKHGGKSMGALACSSTAMMA